MPPSNVDSEASERARNANRAAHVTNLAQIYAFSLPYPAVPQSRLLQTATTTNLAQSKKPARAWSTEKSSFDRNSTSGLDPSMTCHGNDTMETDPEGHFRSMEEMSAIMLEVKRCHDEESLEHDNSS